MNVLKYSIPEYITNDEDLFNKITKISKADLKNGGEGAIFVHLKQSKKVTELKEVKTHKQLKSPYGVPKSRNVF